MGVRRNRLRRAIENLKSPEPLPERIPGTSEGSKEAYCPIIDRMCGLIACGRCEALDVYYEDVDDQGWFCSNCTRSVGGVQQPYWYDGHCEGCGQYSSILALVIWD